ncbi:hypothetical protein F5Y17DRAFT_83638 [Xylariaceae sp. FL0594]|nr:hypothetical protein F5Y17DRAFT_83638 [Xylariaceae sp. FL0594]
MDMLVMAAQTTDRMEISSAALSLPRDEGAQIGLSNEHVTDNGESSGCSAGWPVLTSDVSTSIAHQHELINDHDCASQLGQMGYLTDLFSGVREPIPRVFFQRIRRMKDAKLQLPQFLFAEESTLLKSLQTIGHIVQDDQQWAWVVDERIISSQQGWSSLLLVLLCSVFLHESPNE